MEKKTSKWISRLRQLGMRRRSVDEEPEEPVVYRRGPTYADGLAPNQRSTGSVRRSIIKMHIRVKNAFKRHGTASSANRTSNSGISEASRTDNRVTLASNVQHKENIYSIEPIGKSSPLRQSTETTPSIQDPIEERPSMNSPRDFPQLTGASEARNGRAPKNEIASLSNCYWYWGPISRSQAEERLKEAPDGAFLVRDSTSDRYLFTMSFRNVGKILHCRIDYGSSGYSLFDHCGYDSVAELVLDAVAKSQNGVYCYTKTKDQIHPNFPVRLTLPVSRYDKVPALKYLARFVIRRYVIVSEVDKLPLPVSLVNYLQEEGPYF